METLRKFIIAIINLRGVSTKLNKYIVFICKRTRNSLQNLYCCKSTNLIPSTRRIHSKLQEGIYFVCLQQQRFSFNALCTLCMHKRKTKSTSQAAGGTKVHVYLPYQGAI